MRHSTGRHRLEDLQALTTMKREDWFQLSLFLSAANNVRGALLEAELRGKSQLSLDHPSVRAFLQHKEQPQFWMRLGAVVAEAIQEQGAAAKQTPDA